MEGFRDIYWQGDEIVWRNLFRHYIYCLQRICALCSIAGETRTLTDADIPVNFNFVREDNVKLASLFKEMMGRVEKNTDLEKFLTEIAQISRKVSIDELSLYLRILHFVALEEIQQTYVDRGLLPSFERYPNSDRLLDEFTKCLTLTKSVERESVQKVLMDVSARTIEGLFLLGKYQWLSPSPSTKEHNRKFLLFDFTQAYLDAIESLVFPDWYVACFMRKCSNSSTWAKYADSHKGVCLIFETETDSGREFLTLRDKRVASSEVYDGQTLRLDIEDVDYGNETRGFDFFRSIGSLSERGLMDVWYAGANGTTSECCSHLVSEPDHWRKDYWRNFSRVSTGKSKDWEYEEECRIVLSSTLNDLQERSRRKLKYDFGSLKGIIFGIGTSDGDKRKIFDDIAKKCGEHSRTDFEFYQAFFSRKSDDIDRYKLICNYRP